MSLAKLTGDIDKRPQADGFATHTATVTCEADDVKVMYFHLPRDRSALFLRPESGTLDNDMKTLTVGNGNEALKQVKVEFFDLNTNGETVTLTAEVGIWENGWRSYSTTPPGVEFSFSPHTQSATMDCGLVQVKTTATTNPDFWCPSGNRLALTKDASSEDTRVLIRFVSEDQVRFICGQGELHRGGYSGIRPDSWYLEFGSLGTDFVMREYDPDLGTFKLWDPETDSMVALVQQPYGYDVWLPMLVSDHEGATFSFNYLTQKPVPPSTSFPYKVSLSGNNSLLPQADGVSPHTATATIVRRRAEAPEFPSPVYFSLPNEGNHRARFIAQLGQTINNDGMQLSAPVDPITGQATAQFVDTAPNGETVAVRAAIEIDPGDDDSYYIESTPIELPFRFVRNIGATLELERDPTITGSRLAAGGKIYQATAVASQLGALPQNAQQATFKLVEGSSATFIPGGNQTTSDDGKTLHAPLNNGQAVAQFQDANMSGELVGLRAYIETSELYVPSVPPLLDYAANLTLELKLTSNDLNTKTLANGISQHTATATLTGGTVDKGDLQVVFQLSHARGAKDDIDAWFVDETANQQVSNDGKTLTAVLVNNQASVKFVDNSMQGEEVWLQASIPNLS